MQSRPVNALRRLSSVVSSDGALVLVVQLSLAGYVLLTSAGLVVPWPSYGERTLQQARGFEQGKLSLDVEPSPTLLAQADPMDPRHAGLWEWDLSLFEGRYYMYWGPAPALVVWLVRWLTRGAAAPTDAVLTLLAVAVQLLAGAWLLRWARQALFPQTPAAGLGLAALVLAWGSPMTWVLARGAIYEVAITWAQAALLLALAVLAPVLHAPGAVARRGLVLSGGFLGAALACRAAVLPTVGVVVAATLGLLLVQRRLSAASVVALLTGPALSVVALAAYNWARFGDPLETGATTQLCFVKFEWHWDRQLANALGYLARAPQLSCAFPFLNGQTSTDPSALVPAWALPASTYFTHMRVVGLAWTAPVLATGVLALAVAVDRGAPALTRWLAVVSLGWATLGMLPAGGIYMATLRYLLDARAGLVLSAYLGGCWLWSRLGERPALRRALAVGVVVSALWTALIGAAVSTRGDEEHLPQHHPALWQRLQQLRVCTPPAPPPVALD